MRKKKLHLATRFLFSYLIIFEVTSCSLPFMFVPTLGFPENETPKELVRTFHDTKIPRIWYILFSV